LLTDNLLLITFSWANRDAFQEAFSSAAPAHVGPFFCCSLSDMLPLHLRVTRIKQPYPVSMPAQDRGEGLNPQGRQPHDFDPPIARG
jgi:hypothetical protein